MVGTHSAMDCSSGGPVGTGVVELRYVGVLGWGKVKWRRRIVVLSRYGDAGFITNGGRGNERERVGRRGQCL